MLSSIHPLGERARNNRWWLTAGSLTLGAVVGGLALGAVSWTVTWPLHGALDRLGPTAVRWTSVGLLAGLGLIDAVVNPTPSPTRQVDEEWLGRYRGWVYGLGYGAQLGFGLLTIVTTATTYALPLVVGVHGPFRVSLALGAWHGLIRGLPVLGGGRLTTPERLREFHRRLESFAGASRWLTVAGLAGGAALVALTGVLS